MKILHISAECYPMAKVGGLGDVVGALPKYQNRAKLESAVVVPMHRTAFLLTNEWLLVHSGWISMGSQTIQYSIIKLKGNELEFDLYCVDIFGILDREKIYGYQDDAYRFITFQLSILDWLNSWISVPDILHLHDHHTAMIPFFIKNCYAFDKLSNVKTVLTIHNAQYQGWMDLHFSNFFPKWNESKSYLMEWNQQINSLACGIRCADKITTVSPTYLLEILNDANGLEIIIQNEVKKCLGIINGIDYDVWNPLTDSLIYQKYNLNNVFYGKKINKEKICKLFQINKELPLIIFIGRLVYEKAADLIPQALDQYYETNGLKFNFILLGNGDLHIEKMLIVLNQKWGGYCNTLIEFNEQLSHQMYAGADFLLMPSRIEPCGLNQMYAMRYGTIPIVRRTGGLNDSVIDIGDGGYGICFNQASSFDIIDAINRALSFYQNRDYFLKTTESMMTINNSWEKSTREYIDLYKSIER